MAGKWRRDWGTRTTNWHLNLDRKTGNSGRGKTVNFGLSDKCWFVYFRPNMPLKGLLCVGSRAFSHSHTLSVAWIENNTVCWFSGENFTKTLHSHVFLLFLEIAKSLRVMLISLSLSIEYIDLFLLDHLTFPIIQRNTWLSLLIFFFFFELFLSVLC